MSILPYQSCHIEHFTHFLRISFQRKQRIQLICKSILAPHQFDQTFYILLHMPCILPGVTFSKISPNRTCMKQTHSAKRSPPIPFRIFSTHKLRFGIKKILIISGAFHEVFKIPHFIKTFSHLSYTIIIISTLQSFRYRLSRHYIKRIISIFIINFPIGVTMTESRRFFYRFISLPFIKTIETFQVSIHNNRNCMIADHTIIFLSP